jgi:hypothetical protein
VDDTLPRRLAAHHGVAADGDLAAAVGWRPADIVAVSGAAVPSAMMPADRDARRHVRRVLERACRLPPEGIASVRGFARSLPAAAPRGPEAPPVASMTFGLALWRLLAVRNLDRGTVCRLVGWPETLLYGLTVGRVDPTPRWMTVLGGVLDLRPDDLAALAGVPPPETTRPTAVPPPQLGGLVLDLVPLSARAVAEVAASMGP